MKKRTKPHNWDGMRGLSGVFIGLIAGAMLILPASGEESAVAGNAETQVKAVAIPTEPSTEKSATTPSAPEKAATLDSVKETKPSLYEPQNPLTIETDKSQKPFSTSTLALQAVFYLIVLAGGALLATYIYKKRRLGFKSGQGQALQILETRMLGNRQFLVVAEYGKQRMLLGVGPGFIKHLAFLNEQDEIDDEMKTKAEKKEDLP